MADKKPKFKRSVGRPVKFESPEELQKLIQKYLDDTDEGRLTLSWLCIACWTNKDTLWDYEKKEEFRAIIKEAKMHIENSYEISLRENGRTGDIFALKNFWWKDKSEVENSWEMTVKKIIVWLPNQEE